MAGIYFHIPFCKQACHYCDFHFSTNLTLKSEIINSIIEEINLQKGYLNEQRVETIYFGGGTPSLLSITELNALLGAIRKNFLMDEDLEVTLEANPDDITFEKLNHWRESGVNRLSIGIQSFDDDVLKFLNRNHSGEAGLRCIEDAGKAGFQNISIDLIYAIPTQDNDQWIKNIQQAIKLNPQHISSYSLTIEEKTVFGRWSSIGKLNAVSDEIAAEQLEILMHELNHAGYDQYEVSNFGKPTYYSRHNSNYWNQKHYLGVGPSAHSYNGSSRQYNISNNHLYVRSLSEKKIPFEREVLTKEDLINEYLLTSLRTKWGCNLEKLTKDFNYDLSSKRLYLEKLKSNGLSQIINNILILTNKGKLLADKIASDLFQLKSHTV